MGDAQQFGSSGRGITSGGEQAESLAVSLLLGLLAVKSPPLYGFQLVIDLTGLRFVCRATCESHQAEEGYRAGNDHHYRHRYGATFAGEPHQR